MSFGLERTGSGDGPEPRLTDLIEPGSLLEATPECLVVAQSDGRIVYANRHVEELTGFPREELVGNSIELLIAAELLDLPEGSRIEAMCRHARHAPIPIEAHVGTLDAPERLLVVALRDVTELQAGREARFEAEAKYRSLVEHIPAVVYLDPVDEDQNSIYVSPQVRDLIGIEPEVWLSDFTAWRNHVHAEDIERAWDEYQEAYTNHLPLNHEYRMVHEDGTVRWVLSAKSMRSACPSSANTDTVWSIEPVGAPT